MKTQDEKRVRLGWQESAPHYKAVVEIEKRYDDLLKENVSNSKRKKLEASKHNEVLEYLEGQDLKFYLGGFYAKEC